MKFLFLAAIFFSASCNFVKEKAKDGAHKAGETGGELIKQVSDGVSDAFDVQVTLSDSLKSLGLQTGNTTLNWDSAATDNILGVYIIFTKDFSKEISVKVFNSQNKEKGRAKVKLEGKKDDARYIDVHFDRHVNIDADDKVTFE